MIQAREDEGMRTQLAAAPTDGKCSKCGANEWQLVEEVQQWHHGTFIEGRGFVFEGNHAWDWVSDEGEVLFLECRSCLAQYEVSEYIWL